MAIAFVAASTRSKADVSVTGSPVNVALPAGHLSGHWLVLYVVTDDNTGPSTPAGWTLLGSFSPGNSNPAPYAGRPHVFLFHRIDTGSLGSSVSVTFNTFPWPSGDPYVLAWTEAYSGVDTAGPVESFQGISTLSTAAAQNHPTATTVAANAWLLSFRAVGADAAKTFTVSGGTNTEAVDDTTGFPASPSAASYYAGPLTAGAQTQRTTTASATVEYGSVAVSLVIKPSGATNVTASPGAASGSATAYDATVSSSNGSWDLCGSQPEYTAAINWSQDPAFTATGTSITVNPYFLTSLSGWSASNATADRNTDLEDRFYSVKVTPNGVSASGGLNAASPSPAGSVTAGNDYRVEAWVYSPLGWSDLRTAIDWYTSAGAFISSGLGSATSVPAGVWTRLSQTLNAPATASRAITRFRFGSTPPSSNVTYVWGLQIIDPSTGDVVLTPAPGDDVTRDVISDISITYGRDQDRQLSPSSVGSAAFSVINVDRKYSPEDTSSPLAGDLNPARDARVSVTWNGTEYSLMSGRLDDYNIKADFSDRSAAFTFLDGLSLLQGVKLSTAVYESMRTGELINTVLDLAGWTGPRDIGTGATLVKFWWVDGTDALTAIQDLVRSEGPPAVAYQEPDGTFVFRDRHHRLQRTESLASQATYVSSEISCASPAATGMTYTPPFTYVHGWRDIVNAVSFDVDERSPAGTVSAVWTSEDSYNLALGEAVDISISTTDPFKDAITPVQGTDFRKTGAGAVSVLLSRTSGASATITFLAVGGAVNISGLQLRARPIPVNRTIKVVRKDTASIGQHGERSYPDSAPWANANDAAAIATMILLHYAQRRPTVQIRIVTSDPAHFLQVLQRRISDRIHITNGEMRLDDDFFVERITHSIQRFNQVGKSPVHAVVLGCEKQLQLATNPFTFDKRGAGFDDGVFDPITSDNASTVFIFDHPQQGKFDTGLFGT